MREILFKAKRIDNGEWIEGGLIGLDTNGSCYFISKPCTEVSTLPVRNLIPGNMHLVRAETICQYTGLTDKNGKKIWENDICDRKELYPEIVRYHEGDWTLDYSYVFGKDYGFNLCNLEFYALERGNVEVIGNIFDNADLLKE